MKLAHFTAFGSIMFLAFTASIVVTSGVGSAAGKGEIRKATEDTAPEAKPAPAKAYRYAAWQPQAQ